MLAIIQRVSEASVVVDAKEIASIEQGIVALIGIEKGDTDADAERLCKRILGYRIFSDLNDKMNLSVQDIQGSLLLVPQFTIVADTSKGLRPSFSSAETPLKSERLFDYFCEFATQNYPKIETGQFAADMKVSLCNDGPVTFTLR